MTTRELDSLTQTLSVKTDRAEEDRECDDEESIRCRNIQQSTEVDLQAFYLRQHREEELRPLAQPETDPVFIAKQKEAQLQFMTSYVAQAWGTREAQIRLSETHYLHEWQLKAQADAEARARAEAREATLLG